MFLISVTYFVQSLKFQPHIETAMYGVYKYIVHLFDGIGVKPRGEPTFRLKLGGSFNED